jgi:hypothetical protein
LPVIDCTKKYKKQKNAQQSVYLWGDNLPFVANFGAPHRAKPRRRNKLLSKANILALDQLFAKLAQHFKTDRDDAILANAPAGVKDG